MLSHRTKRTSQSRSARGQPPAPLVAANGPHIRIRASVNNLIDILDNVEENFDVSMARNVSDEIRQALDNLDGSAIEINLKDIIRPTWSLLPEDTTWEATHMERLQAVPRDFWFDGTPQRRNPQRWQQTHIIRTTIPLVSNQY